MLLAINCIVKTSAHLPCFIIFHRRIILFLAWVWPNLLMWWLDANTAKDIYLSDISLKFWLKFRNAGIMKCRKYISSLDRKLVAVKDKWNIWRQKWFINQLFLVFGINTLHHQFEYGAICLIIITLCAFLEWQGILRYPKHLFFFFKLKRHCVLFCEQAVEEETGNCLHRSLDEYLAIIEWGWVSSEKLWRLRPWMCYRPRQLTPSEISIILQMIRKPNSKIVLFFIQNNS